MPQTGTMEVLSGRSGRTSPQERVYLSTLLDAYGELLAPRQRECCDLYFNEDLSLSEIAETCGISRQGAWDNIRRGSEALEASAFGIWRRPCGSWRRCAGRKAHCESGFTARPKRSGHF